MPTYAAGTEVSTDKSMAEIRRILQRWGASQLVIGETNDAAAIAFVMHGRQVRLILPMPDMHSNEIRLTKTGLRRTETARQDAYAKAIRQRWRAMTLFIKAKLEAVETGLSTFETEFLGHTLLPNGKTVAEEIEPDIARAYETNQMPALLPALKAIEERA